MKKIWNNVKTNPPVRNGMYWVYVVVEADLVSTAYQTSMYYNTNLQDWVSTTLEKEGGRVTHWTYWLPAPTE